MFRSNLQCLQPLSFYASKIISSYILSEKAWVLKDLSQNAASELLIAA